MHEWSCRHVRNKNLVMVSFWLTALGAAALEAPAVAAASGLLGALAVTTMAELEEGAAFLVARFTGAAFFLAELSAFLAGDFRFFLRGRSAQVQAGWGRLSL